MKVVIDGIAPWDGAWDLADFFFTNRELHRIKQLSGIRAGELLEALDVNDTAAYVAVAVVALERAGKRVDPDQLWDAPVGSISLDLGEPEADGVPLDDQTASGPNGSDDSSTADSVSGAAI